jgi:uroporphyrinogen-III synthase
MSPAWPRLRLPPDPAPGRPQPLRGVSLILTRPARTGGAMAAALADAGAEVLEAPAIELRSLVDETLAATEGLLADLRERRGWLILPSKAAIGYFKEALLRHTHCACEPLAGVRLAAVGRASAGALVEIGLKADFVPPRADGNSLGATLPAQAGELAAIVGSSETRRELAAGVAGRGIEVRVLALYAPQPCAEGLSAILQALAERPARLLIVASPSAADALLDEWAASGRPAAALRWLALGPTTRGRLLERGIGPQAVLCAAAPTAQALIEAAAPGFC